MAKFNYFNNTGGLNKFLSEAQLNQSPKGTDWFDAQNVECYKSGGIRKMKGCKNILFSELPSGTQILGIFEYIRAGQSYPVINTSEGKLYKFEIESGELSLLYSGLDTSAKCLYANYNNGVIMTNGVDSPIFYELGSSPVTLGDNAPKGLSLEIFKSRVFIAKDSTLYYSALGNQFDWTTEKDAGYIGNFHNDASPITALKNYGEFLAIYKEKSVYILSGSSPDDYSISPVADKGSLSPFGIGTVNNNQFFFNGESITPLKFNELGQILLDNDISIKIKPVFDELDKTKFSQTICVPYKNKNQIWFYFGTEDSGCLDVCYIFDYLNNCWYKRKGVPIVCAGIIDGEIYTGTSDGRILQENITDSFDGENIEAWWVSPWFSFDSPQIEKEMSDFNIWLYESQKCPVEISFYKNFRNIAFKTAEVSVYNNKTLVWDGNNWVENNYANEYSKRKNVKINGRFEQLQIKISNMNANEPFEVLGFSFEIE